MSPPLLRAEGVGRAFGGPPVLTDVSLDIAAGSITGIVGASGSGKTTLARILAGLLRPDTGAVSFDGIDLASLAGARLRGLRQYLQYVHQDPASALDPRFTVAAILHEPLRVHATLRRAARQERVEAALRDVSLPTKLLDRYPHEISGGQQRRVGLARILILRPRLILFDEPTAGLDLLVQAALLDMLAELRAAHGLTFLIVTHDLAVAETLCERLLVLHRGAVVEGGETAAIFRRPGHAYTQTLLAARPVIGGMRARDRSLRA